MLVDDDANSMLGNVVHASRLPMVAFMRHTFLNGTCALERQSNKNKIVTTKNNKMIQMGRITFYVFIQLSEKSNAISSVLKKYIFFFIKITDTVIC